MAGTLTLHSQGSGDLLSGHSWIEYKRDGDPASTTYGTWGNDPTGEGNGLFRNLEAGKPSDASRTVWINDEQERRMMETITAYEAKGQDGWKYLNPCSGFATEAWQSATGEKLPHRRFGISNPSTLKDSINQANKGVKPGARRRAVRRSVPNSIKRRQESRSRRPVSSRRSVRDACEPCKARSSR